MNKEDLEKLINKDTDTYIYISENGVSMQGSSSNLLTLYTTLTGQMLNLKGVTKDILEQSFKMSFMSKNELLDVLNKEISKFISNMFDELKDKKEDKKEDKTTE